MGYTKGPWVVSSTFLVCAKPSAAIVANCTPLVEIPELSIPMDEVADNARLIAAAPELLDALKDARDHLDYCGYGDSVERECAVAEKLEERIEAAIAKAEGK